MRTLLGRTTDRVLARFLPRVTAAASCTFSHWRLCGCTGGLVYKRRIYLKCNTTGLCFYDPCGSKCTPVSTC